jgi:hypothetical protein
LKKQQQGNFLIMLWAMESKYGSNRFEPGGGHVARQYGNGDDSSYSTFPDECNSPPTTTASAQRKTTKKKRTKEESISSAGCDKVLKHKRRYCREPGCDRIVKSQGLCQRHGARPKKCRIEECCKQAQGSFMGMCSKCTFVYMKRENILNVEMPRMQLSFFCRFTHMHVLYLLRIPLSTEPSQKSI